MRRMSRRALATAVITIVLIGGTTAALAYWTASGGGAATASTGRSTSIAVNQTSLLSGIDPGVAPQEISGDFTNSGSAPVYVTSVTVGISVTKAVGAPPGTCTAVDYTLLDATMPVGTEVGVGSGVGSWGGATIAFNDSPSVNQDACKGATIVLTYTVS